MVGPPLLGVLVAELFLYPFLHPSGNEWKFELGSFTIYFILFYFILFYFILFYFLQYKWGGRFKVQNFGILSFLTRLLVLLWAERAAGSKADADLSVTLRARP